VWGSQQPPILPTMICPECGSEYREGFTRCSDCDIDLVEPLAEEPEMQLVRVYEGFNPALLPLVESLLNEADIEFMKRGEPLQDLFAGGRLFGGNQVVGPVEFWVSTDNAERARELLAGVDDSLEVEQEFEEEFAEDEIEDAE
jgi:hypothetical protein